MESGLEGGTYNIVQHRVLFHRHRKAAYSDRKEGRRSLDDSNFSVMGLGNGNGHRSALRNASAPAAAMAAWRSARWPGGRSVLPIATRGAAMDRDMRKGLFLPPRPDGAGQ